jgi:hypothetical protein
LNDEYLKEYLFIPIPADKENMANGIIAQILVAKEARAKELTAISHILEAPQSILS